MAESLLLALIGHLVGDFLLQNDIQALNKTKSTSWCLIHVLIYTITVAMIVQWPEHTWGFCFAVAIPHFVIDRWRLARKYMWLVGQEQFATGPLSPWSIIVVDQVMHVVCLWAAVRFVL